MKFISKFICGVLVMMIFCQPVFIMALENKELIKGAKAGVLIEANTGKIIFEKNKNEKMAIASMTKMVAQIIILEEVEKGKIKWNDVVTVSKNAADMGGSQIYISEGEKISIEDLMKGISMASGNDATVAMAEVIAGSEEKFVKMMNKKVQELGLKNTYFKNCTGLDEEGHYSSAYDMAMIARELVTNHPEILRFSSMYEDYLRENTDNKFWLVNTNKLVRFYEGADGLKTGHTDNAGYCLAATAKKNNMRLIAIVLGEDNSKTRNSETMALLDYGFLNTKFNLLKEKGTIIKRVKLDKSNREKVDIILKEDLGVVELVDDSKHKYNYNIKIDDIKLPLSSGDVVGKIEIISKNKVVTTGDLIVNKDAKKLNIWELFYNSFRGVCSGEI